MGNKYIYNQHIAPITANARDGKGAVLFTKVFQPERIDGTTGRVVSTGYTTLTDEEYDQLCKGSKTFPHYLNKLKLLAVCDDIPPEAKTPQEALADARRKAQEAQGRISELESEIAELEAELFEAENAYKTLSSASTDEEKLKSINAVIERLNAENSKLKAALKKAGVKGKDFE